MSYKAPMVRAKEDKDANRKGLMDLTIEEKDRIFKDYRRGRLSIEELADKHKIKYSSARRIIKQNYRIFDTRRRQAGGYFKPLRDRPKVEDIITRVDQKKAQKIYLFYCSEVARKKRTKDRKLLKKDPADTTCLKHHVSASTLRRIIQFYKEKKEYKTSYQFDQVVAYRKNLG